MATNHHHPPCHCHPTPPPPTTTCYCTMCYTTTLYPPPPPPPDPQLHPISSLHHHHHAPPQNHHHQHAPPQHHYNHTPLQPHHSIQTHSPNSPTQQNPTVSSLIHRISALESSLRRRKPPPPPPPSLRDAAARTIQTHFRSFLVRRSVTLRHLKDLAHIKSALNHLKSCVSNNAQFDQHSVARKSMSLLINLDSIQGSDPMIRDGKRSISRELTRFMELIDEICTESQMITVKNVRFSKNSRKSVNLHPEISIKASSSRVFGYNNERKFPETLKNQRKSDNDIDESPLMKSEGKSEPKVKKNVTFDEKGNVYRLIKVKHNADSGSSDGSESCNGEEEEEEEEEEVEVEDEVEELGVSVSSKETEDDESSEMSENEMDPRKKLGTRSYHPTRKNQSQRDEQEDDDDEGDDDDSFVFSAPLPAKMEYRVDSGSKKQPAKH